MTDASNRPLTGRQKAALQQIVASNGGGVSRFDIPIAVIDALTRRGLIQFKSGHVYRVVHTPLGLETARQIKAGELDL